MRFIILNLKVLFFDKSSRYYNSPEQYPHHVQLSRVDFSVYAIDILKCKL